MPIFAPPFTTQFDPIKTLLPIVISFLAISSDKPIHFLWESAALIETNEAISQLSPIVTLAYLAFISEKPAILTFLPILGLPFIQTKGWYGFSLKVVPF